MKKEKKDSYMYIKLPHFFRSIRILPFRDIHLVPAELLIKEFPEIFTHEEIKSYREELLRFLANPKDISDLCFVHVLQVKGKLIGLIMFYHVVESQGYFKIEWLVVKKDDQNNGYGTLLVKEAFQKAKLVGGKYIYVETSNEKHNAKTKKFYEKLGFKQSAILPNFFGIPIKGRKTPEDYILYFREL